MSREGVTHLGGICLAGTVDADVLRRMARRHLVGAAYFARESFRLESSGLPCEQAQGANQAYATAAIMLNVAALEAAINEFYLNAVDGPTGVLHKLTPAALGLLRTNWPGLEKKKAGTLEKYQSALCDCGKPQLSKAAAPYHDAHLLVRLRNALVHFKPEWDSSQGQSIAVSPCPRSRSSRTGALAMAAPSGRCRAPLR